MTRDELFDEISDMDDLYRFCIENEMYEFLENNMQDVVDENGIYDWVENSYVPDLYSDHSWTEVLDDLEGIRYTIENNDWFYVGNWCVEEVDDSMFRDLREELLDELENTGYFDDEDDGNDNDYIVIEPGGSQDDSQDFECEDFSIMELVQESKDVIAMLPRKKSEGSKDDNCSIDVLYAF